MKVKEMCMETIRSHLEDFLSRNADASYEDWIRDLHPDNAEKGSIDPRFFVLKSDHRILWNENHQDDTDKIVAAVRMDDESSSRADEDRDMLPSTDSERNKDDTELKHNHLTSNDGSESE